MHRLYNRPVLLSALFVVINLGLASCTPVSGGDGNVQPLVDPGSTCAVGQNGTWLGCLGSDGVSVCAFQTCDRVTNIASICWQVSCPATVPTPVPGPTTGVGQCDTGSVNLSCTTTDGTLRPGYQYCDVANRWGACIPYAGIAYDSGVPTSVDSGIHTACESDPQVLGMASCVAGLGVCAVSGTWVCNASNVKVCSMMANEAARGSEGITPDGLDNDCNGLVDDNISRSCYPFPTGNPGVGICRYGSQTYNPATATWSICAGAIGPGVEIANDSGNVDEDCNGGFLLAAACGGDVRIGTPCSAGIGSCMDTGVYSCVGAELVCSAVASLPSPEVCDGFDNDCDGGIDGNVESCYTGRAGSAGIGLCRAGTRVCTAGAFGACTGEVLPSLELCGNTFDEDCNGIADSCVICGSDSRIVPTPQACSEGIGACQRFGTYTCASGVVTCNVTAGAAVSEACNGIDDDCDGLVDESVIQTCSSYSPSRAGVGNCVPGTQACIGFAAGAPIWGFCTGEVRPTAETCGDLIDQDCNGADLACSPGCGGTPTGGSCTVGRGRCATAGTFSCVGGMTLTCVPTVAPLDPIAETCNGIDDNCDGLVDNDVIAGGSLTNQCYLFGSGTPGLGVCTYGTQICSAGAFGACVGQVGPSTEVCDGIDNNCNGGVDEYLSCGVVDAGAPAADAGTPPPTPTGWTAAQTAYCRAARVADGYSGVVSAALDLTCVNSRFGTCASGWMLTINDQHGCPVPSNPGVLSVSMDLANVSSGTYRLGLWCGSTDAHVWPAPRNVPPVCVTSYVTAGVDRTSAGAVCPGPAPGSFLLPEFPANPAAPAMTCP